MYLSGMQYNHSFECFGGLSELNGEIYDTHCDGVIVRLLAAMVTGQLYIAVMLQNHEYIFV